MRESQIDDVVRESMRQSHNQRSRGYTNGLHGQSHNDSVQKVRLSRERRRQRKVRS